VGRRQHSIDRTVSASVKNVSDRNAYAIYVRHECVYYVYSPAKHLVTLHYILLDYDWTGTHRLAHQIDALNPNSYKRKTDRARPMLPRATDMQRPLIPIPSASASASHSFTPSRLPSLEELAVLFCARISAEPARSVVADEPNVHLYLRGPHQLYSPVSRPDRLAVLGMRAVKSLETQ